MKRGQEGESVKALQRKLNEVIVANGGTPLKVDGKFGAKTEDALEDIQRTARLAKQDGILGRDTFAKVFGPRPSAPTGPSSALQEGVASISSTYRGGQGASGSIVVNGNTYQFNSGGFSAGRGGKGSAPKGKYKIDVDPNGANGPTQHVNGFGFSYRMLREQNGRYVDTGIRDPRNPSGRSYLRIHPDGGGKGTIGCLGIVGDKATQQRFDRDMRLALNQARLEGRPYFVTVQ
jgi:hypothetical protein